MRKLLYIYTSWCNPCKAVKNTVIKDIEEECPEQVEYIDMSIKPTYPDKYKIKVTTVPRLAFIDNDNTVKAVRNTPKGIETINIIKWLKEEDDDI